MTRRSTFSLHTSKLDNGLVVEKRIDKFGFVRVELSDGRWVEVSVPLGDDVFSVRASGQLAVQPNSGNDLTVYVDPR